MTDHRAKETPNKDVDTKDGQARRCGFEIPGEGNIADQGTLFEKRGGGGSIPSRRTISPQRLAEIASIREEDIDLSDIPEITDFSQAHRVFPATKAPPHLTRYMCQVARVRPHMRVLEPSAGSGGMVKVIQEFTQHIFAVELNAELHAQLDCERALRADFLSVRPWNPHSAERNIPGNLPMCDAVIMCPPKDSGRHIRHALRFLRHGGTLVALVQEQNIDLALWPSYEPVETKFALDGRWLDCGLITIYKGVEVSPAYLTKAAHLA